jgi:hypothetical protein
MRILAEAVALAVLLGIGFYASEASAVTVDAGSWTKDEVKAECAKYGGTFTEGTDGSYLCHYPSNGYLSCKKDGKCETINVVSPPGQGAKGVNPPKLEAAPERAPQ